MTALNDMCQTRRTTITVSRTAIATDEVLPSIRRFEALENRTDLQADEDERQDVQREHDGVPHGVGRDAYPRGNSLRRRLRHRDRVAHHGQDAGEADVLRENPHAKGRDELKDDGRRHVLHPVHRPQA